MSQVDYDSAVAIVGMAGRFPGADTVSQLWANSATGRLGLREVTEDELVSVGVPPGHVADPDYVRVTGSIEGIERFDAAMFGLSRHEAELMDPQHRLFLETCVEVLENAGYPAMGMTDKVGVYAGCGFPDYTWNVAFGAAPGPGGALLMAIGTERDSLGSYASYKLGLRGPSITVQTFCSTSLIAVHLGVQGLLNYECDVALAGGVFLPLPQGAGYFFEEGSIYSPDGRVLPFDAGARGSVMGSGVALVALKRLPDALDAGDHISAIILGSATNNDGSQCAGYTAPGVDGQAAVIADAIAFAGVPPATIGYVECHGTGTVLGDSIEIAAMAQVFPDRADDRLVLASLKANIGHLDRAAGVSSLIRAALALENQVLPATPTFRTPNGALANARKKFTVLTQARPWPVGAHPRRAGVSAFGLGGSNAHVVLEEAPQRPPAAAEPGPFLLTLSGRDATVVDQATANLAAHLDGHEDPIADVAFTQQVSRSTFPVRRAVVCDDLADARAALGDPSRWLDGEARAHNPRVELVLPDPARADPAWCAQVSGAAHRIARDLDEIDSAAAGSASSAQLTDTVLAVAAALRAVGVSVHAVDGPELAIVGEVRDALGLGAGRHGQVAIDIAPDGRSPAHWMAHTVARLWQAGCEIDWAALYAGRPRRVPLPTYPFQRRRYWVERPSLTAPLPEPSGRVDDLDRWTYVPTWRSSPRAIRDETAALREAGPWLVLAAEPRGVLLAEHLRRLGADVTLAQLRRRQDGDSRPGGVVGELTGEVIDPATAAADLEALLRAAAQLPRVVVHAGALGDRTDGPASIDTPGDPLLTGYRIALALVTAFNAVSPGTDVELLALTDAATAFGDVPPGSSAQAALAALLPVLAQENPGWVCRHLDIGTGLPVPPAHVVAEALEEHAGPVALRGSTRWTRAFDHVPLAAQGQTWSLPPGGVMLVTGGLGKVGLALARHAALDRGCRVVLLGRTPVPPRARWSELASGTTPAAARLQALLAIEERGGQVEVVTADVADVDQVRAAIETTLQRFGALDLVVHAAGSSAADGFGPAQLVCEAGTAGHFDAKVAGLRALDDALGDRDVALVAFSSLSATLGGLALGPYAAANAALDVEVLSRRVRGRRWCTVHWDTWGIDGGDPFSAGEFDMAPSEAMQIFDRIVAAVDQVDHLVISTGPLDARFTQWVVESGLGGVLGDDGERDPRPDLSTPYAEPAPGLQSDLAEILTVVLRLERVGLDDDFFALGGNSVLAIALIARIRKQLQIPVPTSAVMGYPTVRGLAAQITEMAATPG
ncbi:MAG: SDR family NAD(P)-dependent oxidoreductase [Kineosporiaceae bacterium]|nr:SDR family NAD(P)-dependent oxidoreductase [Kineosporiaceae bacterium]